MFDLVPLTWEKVGDLSHSRHGHAVIYTNGEFLVIGGATSGQTESCILIENNLTCVDDFVDFGSETFFYYPELFTVPSLFCA